jgi:hypothetical protein
MRQTRWPEVEEVWCAAATAAADVDGNRYRAGGQSGSVVTLELSFYFPVAWGSNNIRRSITVWGECCIIAFQMVWILWKRISTPRPPLSWCRDFQVQNGTTRNLAPKCPWGPCKACRRYPNRVTAGRRMTNGRADGTLKRGAEISSMGLKFVSYLLRSLAEAQTFVETYTSIRPPLRLK